MTAPTPAEVESALDSWDDIDEPADVGEATDGTTSDEVRQSFARLASAEESVATATRRLEAAQDALADAQGTVRVAEAGREDLKADAPSSQRIAAEEAIAKAERARQRARAEVVRLDEELESVLGRAAAAREELDAARQAAAAQEAGGDQGRGEAPPLYFGSVDEFVREFIVPTFRRKVGERGSFRWSAEWWRYPEAIMRLDALWRSWEFMRLDPNTGLSVWLRDHADHHLTVLFSDYGPFGRSEDTSQAGEPLPYTRPPPGRFPDVRESEDPA